MSARYDTALMAPPVPGGAVDAALLARLRAWCDGGAWTAPLQPLCAASTAPHDGLDAVACELDGSHALARLSRAQGLAWRAGIALRERLPGGGLTQADPWDCGWWRGGVPAAAAFTPRRATLLLVRAADGASAAALLDTLSGRSSTYRRPLRVLCISMLPRADMPRL